MSASKIERKIDEIQDYIANCKYKALSKDIIMVNREEIDALVEELRDVVPEEVDKYQEVLQQKDEIFADAKNKAAALIKKATDQMNRQISEDEVMKQAVEQANALVAAANTQAQTTTDTANAQAQAVMNDANSQAQKILDDAK